MQAVFVSSYLISLSISFSSGKKLANNAINPKNNAHIKVPINNNGLLPYFFNAGIAAILKSKFVKPTQIFNQFLRLLLPAVIYY